MSISFLARVPKTMTNSVVTVSAASLLQILPINLDRHRVIVKNAGNRSVKIGDSSIQTDSDGQTLGVGAIYITNSQDSLYAYNDDVSESVAIKIMEETY